ncbi:MAG: acyltransferase family protein, partial [Actinomycetota bacterium]|nr:acyltransferase family protein [Actinomycetota bacterium]
MSQPARSTRIVLFDVWRIVAVALVVGVHLLQKAGHPWGRMFGIKGFYQVTLGGVGVTLLLVLSGAVLAYTYSGRDTRWTTFMTRRLAHLYPMYWISLIFAVAV